MSGSRRTDNPEPELMRRICEAVLRNSPVSTWIADKNGTAVYANEAARRLFGIASDEEVVGKYNIFEDEALDEAGVMPQVRKVFDEGGSTEVTLDYDFRKVGHISVTAPTHTILRGMFYAITDAEGDVGYVVVQHEDLTDRIRTEQALAESEERFRDMVEGSADWIWEADTEGRCTYTSPAIERILGYAPDEVIGRPIFDFVLPEYRDRVIGSMREAAAENRPITVSLAGLKRKNGSACYVEVSAKPVFDKSGLLTGYRGMNRNVTSWVAAEKALDEQRRWFRALIENAADIITVMNADATMTYVSPSVERVLGYAPEELIGKSALDYVHPDDWERGRDGIALVAQLEGELIPTEFRLRHKDGTYRVFEALARSLLKDPSVRGIVVNHRDITVRRRAEEELKASEERFRALTDHSSDIIMVVAADATITYVSPAIERILGFRQDEIIGRHIFELAHPDDAVQGRPRFAKLAARPGLIETAGEYRLRHKDGSWLTMDVIGSNRLDDPAVNGIIITHRDITARKKAEEDLSRANERLSTIIATSPPAIVSLNLKAEVETWNPAAEHMYGWRADEVIGKPLPIVPEDKQAIYADSLARLRAGEVIRDMEAPTVAKDGSFIENSISIAPLHDGEGRIVGFLGILTDITERKHAEEALKASEEKYRSLVESAADAVISADGDGSIVSWNAAAERIFGYAKNEVIGRPITMLMPERSRPEHQEALDRMQQGAEPRLDKKTAESVGLRKDGTEFPMEISLTTWVTPRGRYYSAIVRDITMRKQAEEDIRKANEELSTVLNTAPLAVISLDRHLDVTSWNPAAVSIFGWTEEEVLGRPVPTVPAEGRAFHERMLRRVLSGEVVTGLEVPALTKDGRTIQHSLSAAPIHDRQGSTIGIVAVGADVTERVQAERAVEAERARFKAFVENSSDVIMVTDETGVISYVSPSVTRILGYEQEDLIRTGPEALVHPDDIAALDESVSRMSEHEGAPVHIEFRARHRDGSWRMVEGYGICRLGDPAVRGVIATFWDITERRQAEEALRQSEERYRQLVEMMNEGLARADADFVITYANQRFADMLGYTPQEMVGHGISEYVAEDARDLFGRQITKRQRGEAQSYELPWRARDGHTVYTLVSPRPIFDEAGSFAGSVAVLTDITDRRQAEEAIKASVSLLSASLESTADGILIVDREGVITRWNQKFADMWGIPEEVLSSRRDADVIAHVLSQLVDPNGFVTKVEALYSHPEETSLDLLVFKDGRIFERYSQPQKLGDEVVGRVWSFRDVTERKRAEEQLQRREQWFRSVLGYVSDIIVVTDSEMSFIYASESVERVLGYKPEEMVGKRAGEFVHPDDLPVVRREFAEVVRKENTYVPTEFRARHADGHWVLLEATGNNLLSHPAIRGIVITARDITERKAAAERIRESEERLTRIIETAPSGITIIDSAGKIVFANPAAERILGLTRSEIVGRAYNDPAWRITSATDGGFPEEELPYVRVMRTGEPVYAVEHAIEWPDGKRVILSVNAGPLRDAEGRVAGVVASITDITERKKAEEALAEAEAKYRGLVEQSLVGVYLIQDGRFVYVNPHFAEVFGYTQDEIMGMKSVAELVAPEDRKLVLSNIRKRLEGEEKTIHYTFHGLRRDGRVIDVEVIGSSTVYQGRPAVIGSLADITERRLAEERQRELERHKREFYRRTIEVATNGKLVITERDEIEHLAGEPIKTWEIKSGVDLSLVRQDTACIARERGMDETKICDFILAVGEATTNAYKHAGGGTASLHQRGDDLIMLVSDQGMGMDALALPEVALRAGYSTAASLGMGYKAMLSVADKVYLATGPAGTTVAVEMAIHAAPIPVGHGELPDTW